jgi:hypothetical protein
MNDTTEIDRSTLFRKLAEVTGQIRHIPKNGVNTHFGYKFATDADVSAALSKELSERNVQAFVSAETTSVVDYTKDNGKTTRITDVLATITFACGETGATFSVTMPGTGDDALDKGTYKAITGAVKYALLKTFLVATGDDPEVAEERQREQLAAVDAAFAGVRAPAVEAEPAPQWPDAPATPDKGVQALQSAFGTAPAGGDRWTWPFGTDKGKTIDQVSTNSLKWGLSNRFDVSDEKWGEKNAKIRAAVEAEIAKREQAAA